MFCLHRQNWFCYDGLSSHASASLADTASWINVYGWPALCIRRPPALGLQGLAHRPGPKQVLEVSIAWPAGLGRAASGGSNGAEL